MDVTMYVTLKGISEDQFYHFLQAVRTAERTHMPDSKLAMFFETRPPMTKSQAQATLERVAPPFGTVEGMQDPRRN